jgi:hypothetical protein
MLVGINLGTFDVGEIEEGEYFVSSELETRKMVFSGI